MILFCEHASLGTFDLWVVFLAFFLFLLSYRLLFLSVQILVLLTLRKVSHDVLFLNLRGAGHSSEVERSLMVRWVVGSILHGVDPLSYFSFQPVLHDWCTKDHGICYPVCGMMHIKEPLLLIGKSSLCGGSRFLSRYLSGHLPYA